MKKYLVALMLVAAPFISVADDDYYDGEAFWLMEDTVFCRTQKVIDAVNNGGEKMVTMQNHDGETLLIKAADKGCYDIAKFLISKNADVNAQDFDGETALMKAASEGQTKLVKLLIDNKADLNLQDRDGKTALMEAADDGYNDIVTMLLKAGADKMLKDRKGRRAIDHAEYQSTRKLLR